MALHARWSGNTLVFYDGATDVLEIDGDNDTVDIKVAEKLKLAGTAVTASAAELNLLDGSGGIDTAQLADGAVTNAKVNASAAIARSKLAQDAVQKYGIPAHSMRGIDGGPLPTSEDTDDLSIDVTANVHLLKGRTPVSATEAASAIFQFVLPPEYDAAQSIFLFVQSQLTGTGTDNGSSYDAACYKQDGNGAVGSDLITTAAKTYAAKDTWYSTQFSVTEAGLAPGDILNFVITATGIESGGANPVQVEIDGVAVQLDIRG